MFGLLERDIKYIRSTLIKFPEIESAIIFGSRAMGNYKKGSDVDIAIVGSGITKEIIFKVDEYLNQIYPLPYFFDIVHYDKLSNKNLVKHIDELGKQIYR